MKLHVNDTLHDVPDDLVAPEMPLLWALRDVLQLTGTKYACGIGVCGACTVHVDGRPVRACVTPLATVAGKAVRTVEGLGAPERPHAVQRAWEQHQVPQCGYCQSGMVMAAAALLERRREPSDAEIDAAIDNLCRCGSTPRVREAVRSAARLMPLPARRRQA